MLLEGHDDKFLKREQIVRMDIVFAEALRSRPEFRCPSTPNLCLSDPVETGVDS